MSPNELEEKNVKVTLHFKHSLIGKLVSGEFQQKRGEKRFQWGDKSPKWLWKYGQLVNKCVYTFELIAY